MSRFPIHGAEPRQVQTPSSRRIVNALGVGRWAGRTLLVTAIAAVVGCGNSSPLLSNAHPSAESLAQGFLDALQRRDAAALEGLALNESEFREHVWPELPAARPERNLPFSYVWGDLRQKSEQGLNQTLARYGGRKFTLLAVAFDGERTEYPSYVVHRETRIRVREGDAEPEDLRLFGSSLEKGGVWKIFSYVVDE